jgi:hypothetical protein
LKVFLAWLAVFLAGITLAGCASSQCRDEYGRYARCDHAVVCTTDRASGITICP